MGRRHAAAQAGIARAQADEQIREAETRRMSAEQERQLLTSYLGSQEQVAGTGRFDVNPDVLKYTQRYSVDDRTLLDIQAAGSGIKNQGNPFQSADNALRGGQDLLTFGRGFANQANDLLAQAEAAARSGDNARAEQLYMQAQQIISGVSPEAQGAYNLVSTPESSAAVRASSAEARIVGRQLLTARELGDPTSQTSTELRGRLLDPALAAVDENTRNAERAIAAERSQIEGEIRQQAAGGGVGFNSRAQLAAKSRAASESALQRAIVYSEAGQQKAAMTAQVSLYMNEFAKRMAEDSVALAQEWVNGTAGVRDIYQESLTNLNLVRADLFNQWAQMFFKQSEARRAEGRNRAKNVGDLVFGTGAGATSEFASQGITSLFATEAAPAVGAGAATSGVGATSAAAGAAGAGSAAGAAGGFASLSSILGFL